MRAFLRAAMIAALLLLPATFATGEIAVVATASAQTAPAPSTAPVVVTTSGDVTADTKISIGTLAGQALTWIAAAFSVPAGALIVGILTRILQGVGFSLTEAWRKRLEDAIVNGINYAAPKASGALEGRLTVDVKSKLLKDVIEYVAAHIPDTLKKLGIDVNTPEGKAVIAARVEKALNSPTTPTPANVTPAAARPA